MKKRFAAVVISLFMMAFMAACGGSSGGTGNVAAPAQPGSHSQEADEQEDQEKKDAGEEEAEKTAAPEEITIEEQVLLEQDGIRITAKEYVTDSIWGDGVKLLIENESDQDYTVLCDALIVNEYMITDLFYSEVAAGKKANSVMYLSTSELKAAGIDPVGRIEIYFRAYDSDYNDLFSNVYAELQTSAYDSMVVEARDDGFELYNDNDIRIVGTTVDEDSFWGAAILLYVENHSDRNVGISVDNMSINGFMVSPFFTTTVYSGRRSLEDITIFDSDLQENDIKKIEEVELQFHIYDADTYMGIADSDAITFSVE